MSLSRSICDRTTKEGLFFPGYTHGSLDAMQSEGTGVLHLPPEALEVAVSTSHAGHRDLH